MGRINRPPIVVIGYALARLTIGINRRKRQPSWSIKAGDEDICWVEPFAIDVLANRLDACYGDVLGAHQPTARYGRMKLILQVAFSQN